MKTPLRQPFAVFEDKDALRLLGVTSVTTRNYINDQIVIEHVKILKPFFKCKHNGFVDRGCKYLQLRSLSANVHLNQMRFLLCP